MCDSLGVCTETGLLSVPMKTDSRLRDAPDLPFPFALGVPGDLLVKELGSRVWREGTRMSHLGRTITVLISKPTVCFLQIKTLRFREAKLTCQKGTHRSSNCGKPPLLPSTYYSDREPAPSWWNCPGLRRKRMENAPRPKETI